MLATRFEGVFTTSSSAHGDVAEQSDARRVAEPWFLKWRIARGDRVIRAVLPTNKQGRPRSMTTPDEVVERPTTRSHGVLHASLTLPIIDFAGVLLVRLITSAENRTAVLGLFTFLFAIGCAFALFALLLSDRRPIGHVIAYVSIAGVLTLLNFGFFVFARRWERTFESM